MSYDDQHLARQRDRLEEPVEARDDAVALVVDGDDDRDARDGVTRGTPLPSRFQMSTTGLSTSRSRYSGCGAPMTSRSDSAQHLVERHEVGVVVTYGSVHEHRVGLEAQDAACSL